MTDPIPYPSLPDEWANKARCPVCNASPLAVVHRAEAADQMAKDFHLRAPSLDTVVGSLSGGNQQKVALAKWALTQPKLMLLDEPTRGIDVGAKREIYALIERWKSEGLAILLITSELPELLMLSDRIVVMHRGHVVRTLDRAEATGEKVIEAAMNKEVA